MKNIENHHLVHASLKFPAENALFSLGSPGRQPINNLKWWLEGLAAVAQPPLSYIPSL